MPEQMKAALDRIAELNRALAETRIDSGTYEKIIDLLPDGILLVNREGIIMLVNQQVEYIFNYPRTSLIGKPVHTLLSPDQAARHAAHVEAFFRNPSARPMLSTRPFPGVDAEGRVLMLLISIAPVVYYDGVIAGAVIRRVEHAA